MRARLGQIGIGCLEGLCENAGARAEGRRNCVRIGRGGPGIERMEAHLLGQAYSPHRHDTYAIGVTLSGVQIFNYRGRRRHCLPGQYHILHPDEPHDGGAGTAEGFSYRILYLDPALVQQALGGRPLPFLADPIIELRALPEDLPAALWRLEDPIEGFVGVEMVSQLTDLLGRKTGEFAGKRASLRLVSLLRIRDLISADPASQYSAETLENVAGLDRWTLARQFRAAFGTSPSRFRTMRQLDRVRRMIRKGLPLAEAALAAGFADQSHMSRLFKRTYGLTPAKWAAALA
jgi:AraC-like DNA-binding protein